MLFTTSWDDGHILDRTLVDLLRRYSIRGTFYISKEHPLVNERLSEQEICNLSKEMEIGAHTITHPDLTAITMDEVRKEIADSKVWIESITEKPCELFCYPRGRLNATVMQTARDAGFRGARTTELYRFDHTDPFAMPVSLNVYPFPFRPIMNRRAFELYARARKEVGSFIPLPSFRGWFAFAKALFDHAYVTKQPYFHMFGHSWEVEKFGMWNHLEKFLAYVASKTDVQHGPNSSLLNI